MSETTRLALPLILAAQAQKHVTHNEALAGLDVLVHLALASRTILAPPPAPAEGDSYLLDGAAGGSWTGQDGNVAAFISGDWQYFTPVTGWRAWVTDDQTLILFDGTIWKILIGFGAVYDNLQSLGINATADSVNRLSARTEAVLFSAIDAASGGIGDIQFKINKETETDTASLLFQSGFSGRAEMGLAGSDDFTVKVSPDGASWVDALVIDKDSGDLAIGTIAPTSGVTISRGTNTSNARLRLVPSIPTASSYVVILSQSYSEEAFNILVGPTKILQTHGFSDADSLSIGVKDFERTVNIDTSGNTGIGTISPSTKLHVDGPIRCKSYTVATVPSASTSGAGSQIYVSNEAGGDVLAFSDGTNWRRVTDRAIIS